jgi:CRP/FNR family nitrogen fixation transcriptional regulator
MLPGFQRLAQGAGTLQIERDAEIVAQGDPAEYCYLVISGCVRTVALMEDGHRQVGAFLMPGDLFGWDLAGEYHMSAEAVTPVMVRRIPSRNLLPTAILASRAGYVG